MSTAASPASFNVGDLLSRAWKIVMANAQTLILGALIIVLINAVINAIAHRIIGSASSILSPLWNGPLLLGYMSTALCAARNQPTDFGQLFSGFQRFLPAFLACLIITLFSIIGLIACLVGSLVVQAVYSLTYFYIYDKNLDFWSAMEESRKTIMAAPAAWAVPLLVAIGLIIAGAIPCGIGLLITLPLVSVMLALAYDHVNVAI